MEIKEYQILLDKFKETNIELYNELKKLYSISGSLITIYYKESYLLNGVINDNLYDKINSNYIDKKIYNLKNIDKRVFKVVNSVSNHKIFKSKKYSMELKKFQNIVATSQFLLKELISDYTYFYNDILQIQKKG